MTTSSQTDDRLRWLADRLTTPCPGLDSVNECSGGYTRCNYETIYHHGKDCPCRGGGKLNCQKCKGMGVSFSWRQPCQTTHYVLHGIGVSSCEDAGCPGWVPGLREPDGTVRPINEGDVLDALDMEMIEYHQSNRQCQLCKNLVGNNRKSWYLTVRVGGSTTNSRYLYSHGQTRMDAALEALAQALGKGEKHG